MRHNLKVLPQFFKPVAEGIKLFELRENDRDYKVGDFLDLREWDYGNYTGAGCSREITYILTDEDQFGMKSNFVVLGLKEALRVTIVDSDIRINLENLREVERLSETIGQHPDKPLKDWENSFNCPACPAKGRENFHYSKTSASGELWKCDDCDSTTLVGHEPKPKT